MDFPPLADLDKSLKKYTNAALLGGVTRTPPPKIVFFGGANVEEMSEKTVVSREVFSRDNAEDGCPKPEIDHFH